MQEDFIIVDKKRLDGLFDLLVDMQTSLKKLNRDVEELKNSQERSEFVTEAEFADLIKRPIRFVQKLRIGNELPFYRFGKGCQGKVVFRREDVEKYLVSNKLGSV
jgi:hypothetical protein